MSIGPEKDDTPWRNGVGTIYEFSDWARDGHGDFADRWDVETGQPALNQVFEMIQSWIMFQNTTGMPTVAEVAKAFNLQPYRIAECIRLVDSPYCSLSSDGDDFTKITIELDGE